MVRQCNPDNSDLAWNSQNLVVYFFYDVAGCMKQSNVSLALLVYRLAGSYCLWKVFGGCN